MHKTQETELRNSCASAEAEFSVAFPALVLGSERAVRDEYRFERS